MWQFSYKIAGVMLLERSSLVVFIFTSGSSTLLGLLFSKRGNVAFLFSLAFLLPKVVHLGQNIQIKLKVKALLSSCLFCRNVLNYILVNGLNPGVSVVCLA